MDFPFGERQPFSHRPDRAYPMSAPINFPSKFSSSPFTTRERKRSRVTAPPPMSSPMAASSPSTPPGAVLPLTPPSSCTVPEVERISSVDNASVTQQPVELHDLSLPCTPSPSVASVFNDIEHYLLPAKSRGALPCAPILRLDNITLATFEDFLSTHGEYPLFNHTKIEYQPSAGLITVCAPPTPYHDCSPPFLQAVLSQLARSGFDTPARQDTLQVTQISWRGSDGSYLVPDAAITVLDESEDATAPPPRLFPTIVVEVANSQQYDDAVKKARRWFRASAGLVEVVLLVNFTEKDPLTDAACFIEVFRCRNAPPADEDAAVDSDASTAAFRLPEDPPLLDVYRDGDRRNVIPAADPADDHIVLRYSDFFGSENVPVGRDPAEPVVLQLRILRTKINTLVRLTRAQNESLKRKAGREEEDEGTSGVKRVRASG